MEYVVDGVVPALLSIVIISIVVKLCRSRKARINTGFALLTKNKNNSVAASLKTYSYDELAKATADFSQNNLLGEGAFDFVYKGVLPNGEFIAIEQFKFEHIQGKNEFRIEVDVIKSIHHRNFITLVGYYCSDTQHMLVYEFVPNKTLEFHLHGFNWKIVMAASDTNPTVTFNSSTSKYLVLCDGLTIETTVTDKAKIAEEWVQLVTSTYGGNNVVGLDTEWMKDKNKKMKVAILELITGQTPIISTTKESLVQWARPKLIEALKEGNLNELVDPRLEMTSYNRGQMIIMITCAGKCVSKLGKHRPPMSQIVRALEANISLNNLNVESTSGEYDDVMKAHFNMILKLDQETSQEKSTSKYYSWPNEHGQYPFSSQEQGTSEYCSWSSSEHGQHPSASISSG